MDDKQWQRQMEIFDAACDLPVDERDAYLETACEGDTELLSRIRALIEQADKDDSLQVVGKAAAEMIAGQDRSGEVVERYRLTEKLGAGGMGEVYLAERSDGEFTQQVAIKLMHAGAQSAQMLERFRAERQILAQLQHPNVAQLLDGGVTDNSQPYFVMEYVDGAPLDEYCDSNRLTVRERLRLFVDVCRTVAFAHANLVVHRDIKPSNILVTSDGTIKLLDFGIAKVIEESAGDDDLTRTGMSVMTPSYASPEQALAQPITIATDVYSLGVNFYELLCGLMPYVVDSKNPVQAAEIISGVQPDRPSTAITQTRTAGANELARVIDARRASFKQLRNQLAGDIDVICATAMHKEPARRYASALEFAEDIERHLDGRPINARPDSFAYRSGKFVKRNRFSVAAGVAVVAVIAGVVGTYTYRLSLANEESEAVTRFLTQVLLSAAPADLGVDATVVDAIDRASERVIDDFDDNPRVKTRIMNVLGASNYHMQRFEQAEAHFLNTLLLREEHLGPGDFETRRARSNLMSTRSMLGKDNKELLEDQIATNPRKPDQFTFFTYTFMQDIATDEGDFEAALKYAELAYALHKKHGSAPVHTARAGMLLSQPLTDLDRHEDAEAVLREALAIATDPSAHETTDDERNARSLASIVAEELGIVLARQGKSEEALKYYGQRLRFLEENAEPDNWYTANVLGNMAVSLASLDRIDEAIDNAKRALDMSIRALGEDHKQTLFNYKAYAMVVASQDMDAARQAFESAIAGELALEPDGYWRQGDVYQHYAEALHEHGDLQDAADKANKAWAVYEKTPHPSSVRITDLADLLARIYEELEDEEQAQRWQSIAADT
ncbi:MAG: serine/threonine-protein kinase [Pseudomonadota bacterium]